MSMLSYHNENCVLAGAYCHVVTTTVYRLVHVVMDDCAQTCPFCHDTHSLVHVVPVCIVMTIAYNWYMSSCCNDNCAYFGPCSHIILIKTVLSMLSCCSDNSVQTGPCCHAVMTIVHINVQTGPCCHVVMTIVYSLVHVVM